MAGGAIDGCLGLLSKEAAIVFPLAGVDLHCFIAQNTRKRFDIRARSCACGRWWSTGTLHLYDPVAGRYVIQSFQPSYVNVGHGGQPRSFNYAALATPVYYLKMLLWPVGLHMEHDLPVYGDMWHGDVLAGMALDRAGGGAGL